MIRLKVFSPIIMAAIFSSMTASAQVPVIDNRNLSEKNKRQDSTEKIKKNDHVRRERTTCVAGAVYRPSRKDDPQAAINNNLKLLAWQNGLLCKKVLIPIYFLR